MQTVSIVLFVALTFWGCGAGDKWVNLYNTKSGVKVSGRYVTATKSVKVQADDKGVKLDFGLPDSLPRVHTDRISIQLRKMDFGEWIKNTETDWVNAFSSASTKGKECSKVEHTLTRIFQADDSEEESLKVVFAQEKNGMVSMTVYIPPKENALVRLRSKPPKDAKENTCITAWKSDDELAAYVTSLIQTRSTFVNMLAVASGFDGTKSGTRLAKTGATNEIAPGDSKEGPCNC